MISTKSNIERAGLTIQILKTAINMNQHDSYAIFSETGRSEAPRCVVSNFRRRSVKRKLKTWGMRKDYIQFKVKFRILNLVPRVDGR